MQLKSTEKALHQKLIALASLERKTLSSITNHLQTAHDTKLYAKLGCSTIIKYMIKYMLYSESAARRRYQALRLTQEIPESKALIANGELNLSNITYVQTIMKGETTEKKRQAIARVKGKSKPQALKELFEMVPHKLHLPQNNKRQISGEHVQFQITASNTTAKKLEQLQARTKKYDYTELLEFILDIALEATDPLKIKTRKSKGSQHARTIPALTKREIYHRAQGKCEHPGCGEIHFLEYDHRKPVALTGSNAKENIRLVCRAHNQVYAMEALGSYKMRRYFSKKSQ